MSISTKWFFAGSFITATFVGYLGAFSVSSLVTRQIGDDIEVSEIQKSDSQTVSPKRNNVSNRKNRIQPERMITSIVSRSIFDSSKANMKPEVSEVSEGDGVASSLDLTLLATIVAQPEDYSVALIKEDNSGVARTYGVGFDILGEATVTKIEKNRVYFQRNGSEQLEYIEIGEEKESSSSPVKSAQKGGDGDVQKIGTNKYSVDQSVLDEILANPEKLYTQVRVTPHKDSSGEIDGYRMTGIRRNSVFYKLGVKNGDIVHSVNGQPLTSLSAAMDAYNSLGNSKNFNFDITRRKNKNTFEYEVH